MLLMTDIDEEFSVKVEIPSDRPTTSWWRAWIIDPDTGVETSVSSETIGVKTPNHRGLDTKKVEEVFNTSYAGVFSFGTAHSNFMLTGGMQIKFPREGDGQTVKLTHSGGPLKSAYERVFEESYFSEWKHYTEVKDSRIAAILTSYGGFKGADFCTSPYEVVVGEAPSALMSRLYKGETDITLSGLVLDSYHIDVVSAKNSSGQGKVHYTKRKQYV